MKGDHRERACVKFEEERDRREGDAICAANDRDDPPSPTLRESETSSFQTTSSCTLLQARTGKDCGKAIAMLVARPAARPPR